MPIPISFTEFTDEEVFLANREAANEFFGDITVPDATDSTFGVVKKSVNLPALAAATYVSIPIMLADGSIETTQVVSKAAYDLLQAKMTALLVAMKSAGIMVGD